MKNLVACYATTNVSRLEQCLFLQCHCRLRVDRHSLLRGWPEFIRLFFILREWFPVVRIAVIIQLLRSFSSLPFVAWRCDVGGSDTLCISICPWIIGVIENLVWLERLQCKAVDVFQCDNFLVSVRIATPAPASVF